MTGNNDKVIEISTSCIFANDSLFWPFCWLMKSESQGGPWIVTHIGQGGMVDGWWQSAPRQIAAPLTLRWEKWGYLSGIYSMHEVGC